MKKIRNVTLEILRHGPPHNQLLSPLTEYLALCGNHPSVELRIPYEHSHFLARHRALNYGEGRSESPKTRQHREMELKITAQEIARILASIPSLIAKLSGPDEEDEFTHFEIVFSASELALLPFELADAPNGFPGAGQTLALQNEAPLCMTRRVRRVDNTQFTWPSRPRVLFAAASPPGLAPVPFQSHLAALRQVLDPWIRRWVEKEDEPARAEEEMSPTERLAEYLTILPRASARQIAQEMSEGGYTHCHILAHGVQYKEGYDDRFGLALHHELDPERLDRVSASRLAAIVRPYRVPGVSPYRAPNSHLAQPAVVTIASCHGAGQGSVVGAGSSVAHAVHEAGVPLVVSSQFPLSFAGSVLMTELLYDGLLWGSDPRVLLDDLRRQLKARLPLTHDWASLVAYAALPDDLDRQLGGLRYRQAYRAIEVAFGDIESFTAYWSVTQEHRDSSTSLSLDVRGQDIFKEFLPRLSQAKRQLDELVDQNEASQRTVLTSPMAAGVSGLLASTTKREAEVMHRLGQPGWEDVLAESEGHYRLAFETDPSQAWALVHETVLSLVIAANRGTLESVKDRLQKRWWAAYGLLHRDLEGNDRLKSIWSHSNLIELHMLWLLVCPEKPGSKAFERTFASAGQKVDRHTDQLLELAGHDDHEIRTRKRQSERYILFFFADPPAYDKPLGGTFSDMRQGLVKGLAWQVLNDLSIDLG